jgi:hypothetical protein
MEKCLGRDNNYYNLKNENMKKIGIYTKNFLLYHDLLENLKRRKIPYISLSSSKKISNNVGLIITSHNEIHDIKINKVIAADIYDSIDQVIDIALQMLIGKDQYSRLLIGIDPGEKPGIAIIGDDILLKKTHVNSPENILKTIQRFLKDYPSKKTLIRIGNGSIIYRNRMINKLINLEIPIEIVNEKKTTINQNVGRYRKDGEAAANIALIHGKKVKKCQPIQITRGDIKKIQEESRKLTNGKISISEKTSISVLKGEINLIEAIEFDKNFKKTKRL